ncbi:tripartite tricarboxylate transporter substrate-binding protein [Variovorax paradoxus]|uniref:tripartite tricarboxylate transporter substrate-binding protein n=1 Tax=Variovorax paradoxus TaxID=34073 RepID=UPI003D65F74D
MRHLIAALAILPALAWGQASELPIRLVVGFGAGSTTDYVARLLGTSMATKLGQPVIVENRPGALSTLATDAVVRSKPDGRTLLVGANSGLTTGPAGLIQGVRYDPVADLSPLGGLVMTPYVLLVDPKLPVTDVDGLLRLVSAQPSKGSCASGNANGKVYCELIKRMRNTAITSIPYRSTPAAVTDVMGGQVSMVFLDLVSALPRVRSGQLRPLAVMTPKRNTLMPDVSSKNETALAAFPANFGWQALFTPVATPTEVSSRLSASVHAALTDPQMRGTLEQAGFEIRSGSPKDMQDFLKADLEAWRRLVKDLQLEPES